MKKLCLFFTLTLLLCACSEDHPRHSTGLALSKPVTPGIPRDPEDTMIFQNFYSDPPAHREFFFETSGIYSVLEGSVNRIDFWVCVDTLFSSSGRFDGTLGHSVFMSEIAEYIDTAFCYTAWRALCDLIPHIPGVCCWNSVYCPSPPVLSDSCPSGSGIRYYRVETITYPDQMRISAAFYAGDSGGESVVAWDRFFGPDAVSDFKMWLITTVFCRIWEDICAETAGPCECPIN